MRTCEFVYERVPKVRHLMQGGLHGGVADAVSVQIEVFQAPHEHCAGRDGLRAV